MYRRHCSPALVTSVLGLCFRAEHMRRKKKSDEVGIALRAFLNLAPHDNFTVAPSRCKLFPKVNSCVIVPLIRVQRIHRVEASWIFFLCPLPECCIAFLCGRSVTAPNIPNHRLQQQPIRKVSCRCVSSLYVDIRAERHATFSPSGLQCLSGLDPCCNVVCATARKILESDACRGGESVAHDETVFRRRCFGPDSRRGMGESSTG